MAKKLHTTEPNPSAFEFPEELIRQRAYSLYEQRGREDGHDLEDWFKAEAEIFGRKPSETETTLEEKAASAVA